MKVLLLLLVLQSLFVKIVLVLVSAILFIGGNGICIANTFFIVLLTTLWQ